MRNKSGQAERHEKRNRQLKHWKSPCTNPQATPPIKARHFRIVSSRRQNGFVARFHESRGLRSYSITIPIERRCPSRRFFSSSLLIKRFGKLAGLNGGWLLPAASQIRVRS